MINKLKETDTVNSAIQDLSYRLKNLEAGKFRISDHSLQYMKKYAESSSYYMSVWSQMLNNAARKLKSPVNDSVFADYGGGCGMLSVAAKLSGFKTVIYNDLSEQMTSDAKVISESLGVSIDHFISGDADDFVSQTRGLGLVPDVICAMDVVEHIYNLERWIISMAGIRNSVILLHTTANPQNPVIVFRLKRLHAKSEFKGFEKNVRINDTFINSSFINERRQIITNKFPDLNDKEKNILASGSRGLKKEDIEKMVSQFIENGTTDYTPGHPTNTCDPYTGSWTERLIDLKHLGIFAGSQNIKMAVYSTKYIYSDNKVKNAVKFLLNALLRVLGRKNLVLSPGLILELET